MQLWRRNGWPDAFRTPGSGAWRPYGGQDHSPFPLDVGSGWPVGWPEDRRTPQSGPWIVEVKFDQRVNVPGRGWPGEAFARKTLKGVTQQWKAYDDAQTGRQIYAALFARSNQMPWRIWVPEHVVLLAFGKEDTASVVRWVEVDQLMFWNIARGVLGE